MKWFRKQQSFPPGMLTAWCPHCRRDVAMTHIISGDVTGCTMEATSPCPRCGNTIDVIWPRTKEIR